MGYNECLQLFKEDIKKLDERVEEERNHYARLLAERSHHEERKKERAHQKEMLSRFFSYVSDGNEYEKESVHLETLSDLIEDEKRKQEEYQIQIEKRKYYYESLRDEDIQCLIDDGSDEGLLAAFFFWINSSYTNPKVTPCYLLKDINKAVQRKIPEEILRYLIERMLVYSEQFGVAKDDHELDALIQELMDSATLFREDSRWQSIRQFLRIRETKRMHFKCSRLLNKYERCVEEFQSLPSDFDKIDKKFQEELNRINDAKSGKKVNEEVRNLTEWYKQNRNELTNEIKKCLSQTVTIDDNLLRVKSLEEEIRNGLAEGLEKKHCSEIRSELQHLEKEFDKIIPTSRIEVQERELINQYQSKIRNIQSLQKAAMEEEMEAELQRLVNIENKRRQKQEAEENKRRKRQAFVRDYKSLTLGLSFLIFVIVFIVALNVKALRAPLWHVNGHSLYSNYSERDFGTGRVLSGGEKNYFAAVMGSFWETIFAEKGYASFSLEDYFFSEKLKASMTEEGVLVLPTEVDGIEITHVEDLSGVCAEKIIVPEGITSWNSRTYAEFVSPSSIKSVGSNIDWYCFKEINLNLENIEQFEANSLKGCSESEARLLSAKYIGDYAFEDSDFERVYLPVVETIEGIAFRNRNDRVLKEVYIGDSIRILSGAAFSWHAEDFCIVLDSNGQYSEDVMDVINKEYGWRVRYVDFAELGLSD